MNGLLVVLLVGALMACFLLTHRPRPQQSAPPGRSALVYPSPREVTDMYATAEWKINAVVLDAVHAMIDEAIKPGNQRR